MYPRAGRLKRSEGCGEHTPSPMHLGLDRCNRRSEGARGFPRSALLEIMKNQYPPIFCGKATHSSANRLSLFYTRKRLERRFNGRGKGIEIGKRLTGWTAPLPAIALQSLIDRHAYHPGAKAGLRPESRQMEPDFEYDFLEDVVAVGDIWQHRPDALLHSGQVAIHQGGKAVSLPGEGQFDQSGVFECCEWCRHGDARFLIPKRRQVALLLA
jgi:hypothetical protein